MIGTLNKQEKEATVIGAGIAGLLAAYSLDKAGYQVTLLEAGARAGGLIETTATPHGLVESGAHSVLATAAVQQLCAELGVELAAVRKDSRARFILRDGVPSKFPLRIGEALRTFLRGYFVLADRSAAPESLTLDRWGERFLGRPALQYLLGPFVRGIYGTDPRDVNVAAAFPSLVIPHGHSLFSFLMSKIWRRKPGQRKHPKGPKHMMAPAHGMGALTSALSARLAERLGPRFRMGAKVDALPPSANIVLAVPAGEAARLLERTSPELARALARVRYSPMVAATVFMDQVSLPKSVRGVGVLIPENEGRQCLGVLYNSSSFPNRVVNEERSASFTMMLGGSSRPDLVSLPESSVKSLIANEMRALFNATTDPAEVTLRRWEHAIPQYNSDLLECWRIARETWCSQPGHVLVGNYTGQVSLRGMIEDSAALPQS